MSPEWTAETLVAGQLKIECHKITATQDCTNDPLIFSGPGFIELRENGTITCKIYATYNKHGLINELLGALSAKPGTLYTREDYFTITATAMDGYDWTARKVIISPERSTRFPADAIVTAKLSELEQTSTAREANDDIIALTIADQDETEWRALIGDWSAGALYTGYKVQIATGARNHIRVEVTTSSKLPEHFDLRLLEALSFVLGDTLRVRTSRRAFGSNTQTKLFSLAPSVNLRQRFSPLELRSRSNSHPARELMIRYVQFARMAELPGLWHPCSAHLAHARQASNLSLDAWTVGVCVALEGIATLFPYEINRADKEVINRIRSITRKWLPRFGVPDSIQNRVNGLLGQLTNVRVIDRMHPLTEAGEIDRSYVKAWSEARNKGVHTAQLNQDDFTDPKLQAALTRIFKVQTLINQLVFKLIGYSGPHTDYGIAGFPQVGTNRSE